MMSNSSAKHVHDLFHEAQRRANGPQEPIKHKQARSLLLPGPNNIIFELFNTVVKEISSDQLLDYITNNLKDYLDSQWSNKITRQVVGRLKREQVLDMRAGLTGAPVLNLPGEMLDATHPDKHKSTRLAPKANSPGQQLSSSSLSAQKSTSESIEQTSWRETAIKQVYELVLWQIRTNNVTQVSSFLIKMVIDFGFRNGKLKAEVYDEVVDCFRDWRAKKLIKLYAFGCAPAGDQKLVLSSTNRGDLTKWIANYIDGTEKRQQPDLLRKLALALRDKTKNCIYITNNLGDALMSIKSDLVRCALVVDRLNQYDDLESMSDISGQLKPLLVRGKLYVVSSLDCVEFAPDPTSDNCC